MISYQYRLQGEYYKERARNAGKKRQIKLALPLVSKNNNRGYSVRGGFTGSFIHVIVCFDHVYYSPFPGLGFDKFVHGLADDDIDVNVAFIHPPNFVELSKDWK
jgi:hypothetical protein